MWSSQTRWRMLSPSSGEKETQTSPSTAPKCASEEDRQPEETRPERREPHAGSALAFGEEVADAADGLDDLVVAVVDLVPQVTDEDLDDVAVRGVLAFPHIGKDLVAVEAEEGRVAVRNARRDANDALKKEAKKGDLTEDDEKRSHDRVQELTDQFVKEIDAILAAKEQEILEI